MHCPGYPGTEMGNLSTIDPMIVQAIITRGAQNCCAIPEDCNAGLFVHSGHVQVREAKISNDYSKIEQDQDGDIGPVLWLVKEKKHIQYTSKPTDLGM